MPVGSIVEQRRGDRTVLLVQETADRTTVVETWDDALDVVNRALVRVNATLAEMNADLAAFNDKLTVDIGATAALIDANQRNLETLIEAR